MDGHVLTPPPAGEPFFAGSLQRSALARALGIRSLFGSCGAESEDHHARFDLGAIWILLITLDGGGIVRAKRKSLEVGPKTLLVVPPSLRFTEWTEGPGAWKWIHLRLGLTKNNPLFSSALSQPWVGRPGVRCFELMSEIITRLHDRPAGVEHHVVARLIELLGIVAHLITDGDRPPPCAAVEQACSLMRREPGNAWTVAELARRCGMSSSSFAHRFRAETGTAPRHWLTDERMREARRLLAEQGSIHDIAERLGYSSRYHFTHAFSLAEGMPPGTFQRLAKRR